MNRAEKTEVVDQLKSDFTKARGVFLADFRGLTVAQITDLRFKLHKNKTRLKVVKNRLALRALEGQAAWDSLKPKFDYMTAVAITDADVAATAKSLTEYAKDNDKLVVKSAYVEGKVVDSKQIKELAKLPSREELLAKLLGTLQSVPASFVRVLNGVPSKWVYLLDAVKRQKDG